MRTQHRHPDAAIEGRDGTPGVQGFGAEQTGKVGQEEIRDGAERVAQVVARRNGEETEGDIPPRPVTAAVWENEAPAGRVAGVEVLRRDQERMRLARTGVW